MARSIDQGGAQAQTPPQVVGEVLGVSSEVGLHEFIDVPGVLASQICAAAEDTLELHSHVLKVDGKNYRVSYGTEHFPSSPGILDNATTAHGRSLGLGLWQRYDPRTQDMQPIYLVANGVVEHPLATLNPGSNSITIDKTFTPVTDEEDLKRLTEVVAKIAVASDRKAEDERARQSAESKRSHRKLRRRIFGAVGAAVATASLWFAAPEAQDRYSNWQEDRAEQQAENEAQERAEALQRAADEKAAREEREADVKAFDQKYTLEETIPAIAAGNVGAAQATDIFTDVRVPSYGEEGISSALAKNISHPRSINIEQFDAEEGTGVRTLEIPVKAGDSFRIAHNGSSKDIIVTYFDAKTNTLEIQDYGPLDSSVTSATEIYIQRIAN